MSGKAFLVIEDDEDGGALLERALLKRFPRASVCLSDDTDAASALFAGGAWTGVVVHRSRDADGLAVVKKLRALDSRVAIVLVSGRDQSVAAKAVGASHFLPYSEWQQVASLFLPQ